MLEKFLEYLRWKKNGSLFKNISIYRRAVRYANSTFNFAIFVEFRTIFMLVIGTEHD